MHYQTTLQKGTPIAITIGNFDGLHRGHQQLLRTLKDVAAENGCVPVFITFTPHTLAVVRPDIEVKTLTTLPEKLALVQNLGGIQDSLVIAFDRDVAQMTADAFLDAIDSEFPLKAIVVGSNFSLGKNRMGDIHFLQEYTRQHGIALSALPLTEEAADRISSTRVRTLVKEGRVEEANLLLGYTLRLSGEVIHGDKRGRELGFPTANMKPASDRLLPADGIYVVRVHVAAESDSTAPSPVYNGVTSIGIRPTFGLKERLIETYILDQHLDLYGKHVTLEFLTRLRGEERFDSVEALIEQMNADVQQAREIFKTDRRVSH